MINPESRAREFLKKYTASDALRQAEFCMYWATPYMRNYYSKVVALIKSNLNE